MFKGRLAPEDGAVFLKAMDALMQQLNEETFQREREQAETRENVSAETFFALEREHEAAGLDIDARTAVTAWQGEVMDYGMAVEALLSRQ